MATRVKICGITSLADAEHAVDAGAWAVGCILWPGSRRRCDVAEAATIARALRRRAEVVGVFVDAHLDELVEVVDAVRFTAVQLHGHEGPVYADEVARRTGAKVIKAARVRSGADIQALQAFRRADFHLLDTHVEGRPGGTGRTWDWGLVRRHRGPVPVLVSGGLTPGNVGDAVEATRPFAVDVAGGTDAAPGRKDPAKVEAFISAVQAADARRAEAEAADARRAEAEAAAEARA